MPALPLMLIVGVAFVVEAALGFGSTVVTVALGALFVPVSEILPAFVPLNLAMSTYLVARYRRAIDGPLVLRRVLPAMLVGLPLGMWAARALPTRALMLVFGAFVVVLSSRELWGLARPNAPARAPLPGPLALALLAVAGAIHGAFATGGPLVVYVVGRELTDKAAFRATLSLVWWVLNGVLLVGFAVGGTLDARAAVASAYLAGPLLVGLVLGEWLHHALPERPFRAATFALLWLAGVMLLGRA